MRLGLFGGTFDPVHIGHLVLAEQCREQCTLDQVWFIPTRNPPHKAFHIMSSAEARTEMLEYATAGMPAFQVSGIELEREGTTFTVDTLEQIHDEDPSRELFFLIGADSLADLPNWRAPDRIARLASIVAVNRGDQLLADLEILRVQLDDALAARIQLVTMPRIDIASRDIRRRVRENQSIRFLVPRAVEAYVTQNRLYVDP